MYYIASGSIYEEYDTDTYPLEDIFARAFVIGNKTLISADVANDEIDVSFHINYRSGKITDEKDNSIVGYISKDIKDKYGVSK